MRAKIFHLSGYTLIELLIVMGIMLIITAGILPLWNAFSARRDVETSVYQLYQDFRQAWQYSRSLRDNHKYYGVKFYNNLVAQDGTTRYGYKILLFCNDASCTVDPGVPFDPNLIPPYKIIIKSSLSVDNPEFLENTFFPKKVVISPSSEIAVGDTIIFTPQGSATTDGVTLLTSGHDQITLDQENYFQTITISPLTGNVKIQ